MMERGKKKKKEDASKPADQEAGEAQMKPPAKVSAVVVELDGQLVGMWLESREETAAEVLGRLEACFPGHLPYLLDCGGRLVPDDAPVRLAPQPLSLVLRRTAGGGGRKGRHDAAKAKPKVAAPKQTNKQRHQAARSSKHRSLKKLEAAGLVPDPDAALDWAPMAVEETGAARAMAQKLCLALDAAADSPAASPEDQDAAADDAAELHVSLQWQGRHLKARKDGKATGSEPVHKVGDLVQRERLAKANSTLFLLNNDLAKARLPDDVLLNHRIATVQQSVLAKWYPNKYFFPHKNDSAWDKAYDVAKDLVAKHPILVPDNAIPSQQGSAVAAVPAAAQHGPASDDVAVSQRDLFSSFLGANRAWDKSWDEVVRWVKEDLILAYRNGEELVEEDGVAVLRSVYGRPGNALYAKTQRKAKMVGLANAGATCWLQTALLMLREWVRELAGTELFRELAKEPPSGEKELFLAFLHAHALSHAAPDTETSHVFWLAQAAGMMWPSLEGSPRTSHQAADEALHLIANLLVERLPRLTHRLQYRTEESSSCGPQCASTERHERHNLIRVRMAQMALEKEQPLDLVGAMEMLALEEEELENRCCKKNPSGKAKQCRTITSLPPNLLIHINRETSRTVLGPGGKPEAILGLLRNPLVFTDVVDLSRAKSPPDGAEHLYDVRELILYSGDRKRGHYITIKADGTGKLFLIDNQDVVEAAGSLADWAQIFQLQDRGFLITVLRLQLHLIYVLDNRCDLLIDKTDLLDDNRNRMGAYGMAAEWTADEDMRGFLGEPAQWMVEESGRQRWRASTEEEEEHGFPDYGYSVTVASVDVHVPEEELDAIFEENKHINNIS